MEGHDFEKFCARLLKKNGFKNVEVTKGRGAYYFKFTIFSIPKAGNYIIRYYFYYYMEAGGELNLEIIEFPITAT